MTRKQWIPAVLIFGMVMLISPPAHANVIVPVIVAGWFGMVLVLIPIILIESAILMSIGAGVCNPFSPCRRLTWPRPLLVSLLQSCLSVWSQSLPVFMTRTMLMSG